MIFIQPCTSPTLEAAGAGDMFSEIEMEYTELTTWLSHTSKWLDTLHDPSKHGNINYEVRMIWCEHMHCTNVLFIIVEFLLLFYCIATKCTSETISMCMI